MKRRVVVAGLGSIGRRHVRLLLERDDVHVEVVEPQLETREAAKRDLGVKAYSSFEAMIETRPDVIWIATPTALHADQTIAALEAGAHVFCEKPMSDCVEAGRRMKQAANRASTVLNIGYYLHFWHGMVRLKQMISGGHLGDVLHAHARVGSYTTLVNSISRYQSEQPGSLFFDYAHQPDLFYWLLNAVPASVWVAGFQGGALDLISAPNVADVICEYDSHLITTIHLNYLQMPERHEYEIVGDRGWATVDFFTGILRYGIRQDKQVREEIFVQDRDDIFRAEHRAFFDCVEGRRRPETSAEDGLISTAICEAALHSWRSRERVRLNHLLH